MPPRDCIRCTAAVPDCQLPASGHVCIHVLGRWLTLFLILVLIAPAGATGAEVNAPPGNSGVEEYLETVPSVDGSRKTTGLRHAAAHAIPSPTQHQLEKAGSDGRSLVQFTETSIVTTPGANHGEGSGGSARPARSTSRRRGAPAKDDHGRAWRLGNAASTALRNPEGLGLFFPIMLALVVVIAVLGALRSNRDE